MLVNVMVASVGWLQIVFMFSLWAPISISYNTIRGIAEGRVETVDG